MSYLEEEQPKHYLVSTESGWCWDRNGVGKGRDMQPQPSFLVSTGTMCSNLQHWVFVSLSYFFFPSPNLHFGGKPEFSWSWQNSVSPVTKPLSRWAQVLANHSGSCWALRSGIPSRSSWAFPFSLGISRGAQADVQHKYLAAALCPRASGPAWPGKEAGMYQPFSFQRDVGTGLTGEVLKSCIFLLTTDLSRGKEQMWLETSDFVLLSRSWSGKFSIVV